MNSDQQRWWLELGLQMEGVPAAWPGASREPMPLARSAGAEPVALAARILTLDHATLLDELSSCTACDLHRGRARVVTGDAVTSAPWLFVGEAPGAEDEPSGTLFSGPGGALLEAMLRALGLTRGHDVSLLSVVRCRPPAGRVPTATECLTCLPWLQRQIALLQPRVVVALGKTASQQVLGSDFNLGSLRGKVHARQGAAVIATYHPDYLLRNPAEKAQAWADLCLARSALTQA